MKKILLILPLLFWLGCEELIEEDTTPPTVIITSPIDGTIVSDSVEITCISTDNVGIEKVELYVDSIATGIIDETEPYSLAWNTVAYEDCAHIIFVRAYDTSGNTAASEPLTLTVDNSGTDPQVCFIAGTKIMMSDGTENNIENVQVGDEVKSWNEEIDKIEHSKVVKLIQPIHDDIIKVTFSDLELKNTFDHPYYVKDKGWCAYKPEWTMARYAIGPIGQLAVGDICYQYVNNRLMEIELKSITEELGRVQTYIFELDNARTFFANSILVHNKN
jgi:hypothetical protein